MKLQKAVALRISQLLLKNKLTRYAICKHTLLTEQCLTRILNEKNKDIKLLTITKLSKGLNISISNFFDDDLFNFDYLDLD